MPHSGYTICTSEQRPASTTVSHGFAVGRYSSPPFGSHGPCKHSKPCPLDFGSGVSMQWDPHSGTVPTRGPGTLPSPCSVAWFSPWVAVWLRHCTPCNSASSIDSLVRVSRRAESGTVNSNSGQAQLPSAPGPRWGVGSQQGDHHQNGAATHAATRPQVHTVEAMATGHVRRQSQVLVTSTASLTPSLVGLAPSGVGLCLSLLLPTLSPVIHQQVHINESLRPWRAGCHPEGCHDCVPTWRQGLSDQPGAGLEVAWKSNSTGLNWDSSEPGTASCPAMGLGEVLAPHGDAHPNTDTTALKRQCLPGLESHSTTHRHPCRGFRDF